MMSGSPRTLTRVTDGAPRTAPDNLDDEARRARFGPREAPTTALLTDQYELTMLRSALQAGTAERHSVFELFGRRLPDGRRYGVVAGLGRLLPMIEAFTFTADEVAWLLAEGVVNEPTAAYLRDFRFTGDIDAYREGDLYFPGSPVLTVSGTLGECVVLETLVLSVLNHDTAIASAAARMAVAAGDRPLVEMGSRRTHEDAAVAVARRQQARAFEVRAATSLGRLWAENGEPRKAHDLLAPVYSWFTEGLDTPDLRDAKALLDRLR